MEAGLQPVAEALQMEYIRVAATLYSRAIGEDCPVGPLGLAYAGLLQDAIAPQGLARSSESAVRALQLVLMPFNSARPGSGHLVVLREAVAAALKQHPLQSVQFLVAAPRSLASVEEMVALVEQAAENHFAGAMVASSNGFGWDEVVLLMEVPELLYDEFIEACLASGSVLTLYAHVIKALTRCQSLREEEEVTDRLVRWIAAIDMRRPQRKPEQQLLLWAKTVELLVRQASMGSDTGRVAAGLRVVIQSADIGGEERDNTRGFLGALGFGAKSTHSPRFRVLSRSLAAFLEVQFADGDYLRAAEKPPGAAGAKKVAGLAAMVRSSSKEYASLAEHIEFALAYARDFNNGLAHASAFFAALVQRLFADEPMLMVVN